LAGYPNIPLPTGAFDLEGYGKDNPIGAVNGGEGGPTTTITAGATGANAALVAAATGFNSLNIVVEGEFNLPARLRVGWNKSIIGGRNGTIGTNGITIINASNVIVRNLRITGVLNNDCITIQNTTRVWIDHNDLSSNPNIIKNGPDLYDGLLDVVRGSDWITISWNYLHDHYKASLVGNNPAFRDIDFGRFHISYHHNYWRNLATRGNAGRFGSQHIYNNYYKDFRYQAIHSRSDNQVLVEGNVFTGDTREALSTYGLVIPEDSPNTSPLGDYELDGFANLGAANDFGGSGVNITQVGNFTSVPYTYKLAPLSDVPALVVRYSGLGKI
jgi:pectate lyase